MCRIFAIKHIIRRVLPRLHTPSPAFFFNSFRVVPRLNYRGAGELARVLAQIKKAPDDAAAAELSVSLGLELVQERAEIERAQNRELVDSLHAGNPGAVICFGDDIQLEHYVSGHWLEQNEISAMLNVTARRVSVTPRASSSCHFKLLPR